MVVYSDIHRHNYSEFATPVADGVNSRFISQLRVLDKIFEIAHERGERNIISLGDEFEKWESLYTPLYAAATKHLYDLLEKYPDVVLFIVAGNHDLPNKYNAGISTILAWGAHPRIQIITEPIIYGIDDVACAMIPYNQDHTRIAEAAAALKAKGATRVFSHLDIIGGEASIEGYVGQAGLSLDNFMGFECGVFGHYHMPQIWTPSYAPKGLGYAGCPLQLRPIDRDQDKGCVYVRQDGSVEFIPIRSPQFRFIDLPNMESLQDKENYYYVSHKKSDAGDIRKWKIQNPEIRISSKIIQDSSDNKVTISMHNPQSPISSFVNSTAGKLSPDLLNHIANYYMSVVEENRP